MIKATFSVLLALSAPALAAGDGAQQIQATLTAMSDGVGFGGQIVDYLDKHRIDVEFADQQEPARFADNKILLSNRLPPLPRVLAPYIARETAILMLVGLPTGPERDYMRDAITARCWLELFGERSDLPKLDSSVDYQDASLAASVRQWDLHYQEYVMNPEQIPPWFGRFFEDEMRWRAVYDRR